MSNIFDIAKGTAYRTTAKIMGYNVEWYDNQNEQLFTSRVHFKYPTVSEELHEIDYKPTEPMMEYLEGQLPGLKAAVDSGRSEQVNIDGKGEFYVRSVNRKYDGETLVAVLAEI